MPATVGGYWGTKQLARDLPLPVLYSTSTGSGFGTASPPPASTQADLGRPYGVQAGDTILFVLSLRNQANEANPSYITSVPADWTLVHDRGVANPGGSGIGFTYSHLYVYRKTATASEPATYPVIREGLNGAGFMNFSSHAIRGAGAVEVIVNAHPPAPHYVPAITTIKPNTLLVLAYTAKDPLNEYIPMPPDPPVWDASGNAYFASHWNCYWQNALVEGTYGPTPSQIGGSLAQDQYTVLAISPIPATPTPDLNVYALAPSAVLIGGGTTVTVTGSSFAVGATSVNIGSVTIPAGSVTVTSGTTLTFVAPAHSGGVKVVEPLSVTVGAYTSNARPFTYNTGEFSPSQIDGLLFWVDSSAESTVSLSGSNVTQWRDLSLNRYVFNPWTSPTYTETIFGLKVMTWTADGFQSDKQESGNLPYTFCWVMDPTSGAIYSHRFGIQHFTITGTNTLGLNFGFSRDTGVSTTGLHVWTVQSWGDNSYVWKDGVQVWSGDPGYTMYTNEIQLGHDDGSKFTGKLPEFAVYNTLLSGTDRSNLIQALLDKWGVGGTAPTPPNAPTLNTATPTPTTVALTWTAPTFNGGSAITDYVIERSADGATGWTVVTEAVSTATSYTVTGLTTGTIVYFRIKAVNAIGTGAASNVMSATPAATAPGAPVLNSATPGNTTVALAWTAPSNTGGSALTDYVIERSPDGTSSWTIVTETVSTTPSYTVTGLTNGTVVYFRVAAVNAIGTSSPSNVMNATPALITVPGAPTALGATPGNASVALAWTAPASNGGSAITDYAVQWRTTAGPGSWTTFSHAAATATAITVTGLTNATAYDFQVAAVNAIGTGAYSTTASATPVGAGGWFDTDFININSGGNYVTFGAAGQTWNTSVAGQINEPFGWSQIYSRRLDVCSTDNQRAKLTWNGTGGQLFLGTHQAGTPDGTGGYAVHFLQSSLYWYRDGAYSGLESNTPPASGTLEMTVISRIVRVYLNGTLTWTKDFSAMAALPGRCQMIGGSANMYITEAEGGDV